MQKFSICCTATAKSVQSCPTLCDPMDSSPPGSPVPGILQARTLEWVAISFSNAWKLKGKVKSLSRIRLLATPWTAAYQAPHPCGFPGKSTGVGCHCLLRICCTSSQNLKKKKKKKGSKRKTGFFIITAESQVEMHSMVHSDPSLLWIPGNALGTDFLSWYSDHHPHPRPGTSSLAAPPRRRCSRAHSLPG